MAAAKIKAVKAVKIKIPKPAHLPKPPKAKAAQFPFKRTFKSAIKIPKLGI